MPPVQSSEKSQHSIELSIDREERLYVWEALHTLYNDLSMEAVPPYLAQEQVKRVGVIGAIPPRKFSGEYPLYADVTVTTQRSLDSLSATPTYGLLVRYFPRNGEPSRAAVATDLPADMPASMVLLKTIGDTLTIDGNVELKNFTATLGRLAGMPEIEMIGHPRFDKPVSEAFPMLATALSIGAQEKITKEVFLSKTTTSSDEYETERGVKFQRILSTHQALETVSLELESGGTLDLMDGRVYEQFHYGASNDTIHSPLQRLELMSYDLSADQLAARNIHARLDIARIIGNAMGLLYAAQYV